MTSSFDTSSIPDNDGYWDALSARVSEAVRPRRSGLAWLGADRSAWLAAACILTTAVGVGLFTRRQVEPQPTPALQMSLVPNDAIGRMIVDGQEPPAIASLAAMWTRTSGGAP